MCIEIQLLRQFLLLKIRILPSHDASDPVNVSVSFWLWSFKMPVRAGIIITGNVPLRPIPNSSIFSAVVAENCVNEKGEQRKGKIFGIRLKWCMNRVWKIKIGNQWKKQVYRCRLCSAVNETIASGLRYFILSELQQNPYIRLKSVEMDISINSIIETMSLSLSRCRFADYALRDRDVSCSIFNICNSSSSRTNNFY